MEKSGNETFRNNTKRSYDPVILKGNFYSIELTECPVDYCWKKIHDRSFSEKEVIEEMKKLTIPVPFSPSSNRIIPGPIK